jgi:hypothetical protein
VPRAKHSAILSSMGASRDDFIKYPRTQHLFGSKGTDYDKHLGREETEAFIADPSLIVAEKLDGTNAGIHFTSSGRMALWCCGREIAEVALATTHSARQFFRLQ